MLISAKTTSAPTALTAFAVAAKVKDGSMTSSPCCILHAISDARRAEVPELTAITSLTLRYEARALSNSLTFLPPSKDADVRFASFRTSATAFISSSPTKGLFIGTLTPSIAELDAGGKLLGLAKVVLSHASFNQYPLHNCLINLAEILSLRIFFRSGLSHPLPFRSVPLRLKPLSLLDAIVLLHMPSRPPGSF